MGGNEGGRDNECHKGNGRGDNESTRPISNKTDKESNRGKGGKREGREGRERREGRKGGKGVP
jgi:hypothetical protein